MVLSPLRTVFGNWRYVLLAAAVALATFALAVWSQNFSLLFSIIGNPLVSVNDKLTLPINLLGSITTNFTLLAASYIIAIAILGGINAALISYQIRKQRSKLSRSGGATGAMGILSGVLGLGCVACKSLLLVSLLGTTAGAGFVALLPLKGAEFGIVGVALMLVSLYFITKSIQAPPVCDI